jgi:hypothetical protein
VGAESVVAKAGSDVSIDGVLLQPQISSVTVSGSGGQSTLYISAATGSIDRKVEMPQGFHLSQQAFDASGQPAKPGPDQNGADHSGRVTVAPGGFTWVTLVRN